MKVRWTRPAQRHLESIADYVARNNPRAAVDLVDRIFDCVEALGDHPKLGRTGRVAGTRELVVSGTPYVVPYRLTRDIEILAVFHESRLWPEHFQ